MKYCRHLQKNVIPFFIYIYICIYYVQSSSIYKYLFLCYIVNVRRTKLYLKPMYKIKQPMSLSDCNSSTQTC